LQVTAGEMLGIGGELGQDLFIILAGEAHLTTHSDVGEILVRIARPGDAFPLATLLGSGTLITSGEALTNMELLKIPRSGLLALCFRDTDLSMRIYAATARLFANRYAETLAHLAISAERELQGALSYR
jgi:CRP-like cAMP-binding protein